MGPEVVGAAGKAHGGTGAEGAVEKFAVIAGGLDHADGKSVVETEKGPVAALRAEEAADGRIVTFFHFADIGVGYATFFGLDKYFHGPVHDGGPLRIVQAVGGGEGIFGDHVRENVEIFGHGFEGDALCCQLGDIGRDGSAVLGDECGLHFSLFLERKREPLYVFALGIALELDFNFRATKEADFLAQKIFGGRDTGCFVYQKALVVVENRPRETNGVAGVEVVSRGSGYQRYIASFERFQGILFVLIGHDGEFGVFAEHRDGHSFADFLIEGRVIAVGILRGILGQFRIYAAGEGAGGFNFCESGAGLSRGRKKKEREKSGGE